MPCIGPPVSIMITRAWRVVGLFVVLTGCGGIGLGSFTVGTSVEETDAGHGHEASRGGGATDNSSTAPIDAGAEVAKAPSLLGSPLCNIMPGGTTCNPDELACFYDALADGGADSGTCTVATICADASVTSHAAACRVIDSTPVCSTGLGRVAEGESCSRSSDCQAELECVGDRALSQGVCKRYCCVATCPGSDSFCDIEPVFDADEYVSQLVPVCASGRSCTPLGADCIAGASCTVVNALTGQTACITPGGAHVGEDCLIQNCEVDLACISGTCRQLCKVVSPSACIGGSPCMPLTALSEGIGICSD
jgi:hypothetical protein